MIERLAVARRLIGRLQIGSWIKSMAVELERKSWTKRYVLGRTEQNFIMLLRTVYNLEIMTVLIHCLHLNLDIYF